MKYSAAQETELFERVLACRNDPARFAHLVYPWGQVGTPLANFAGPRAWQIEELEKIAEHTRRAEFLTANKMASAIYEFAVSSGRGPGKSALFAILAHWHLSCHPGAQAIVVANTETQLRKVTFPEIARWVQMGINSHWFTTEGMAVLPAPWFADMALEQLKIDPGYWNITGRTWSEENPDSFVGAHNQVGMMLLFDEAAGIPAPIWDKSDGFFTESTPYRYHMAASQMRRNTGRFYELFHEQRFAHWRTRKISTLGFPGVDQEQVRKFIALHGEGSDEVRVEIHGDAPVTDDTQFIATPDVRMAQRNQIPPDLGAPLIMGVDPAPRGRTVIRFRQGRNARDCCGRDTATVMEGANNIEIARKVNDLARRYTPSAICIDFGQGTGVIDICRDTFGLKIVEVRFGEAPEDKDSEWATRAAELWARLRSWLPGGMIALDDGGRGTLSYQLTNRSWAFSGKEDGRKILEKKADMKARGVDSPDDADALACTFAVRIVRRDSAVARGRGVRIVEGVGRSLTD